MTAAAVAAGVWLTLMLLVYALFAAAARADQAARKQAERDALLDNTFTRDPDGRVWRADP